LNVDYEHNFQRKEKETRKASLMIQANKRESEMYIIQKVVKKDKAFTFAVIQGSQTPESSTQRSNRFHTSF